MATTEYQIFCRYLNENINRTLTNQTKTEWVNSEDYETLRISYDANKAEYKTIKAGIIAGTLKENALPLIQFNIYNECRRYEKIQKQLIEEKVVIEYA